MIILLKRFRGGYEKTSSRFAWLAAAEISRS